MAISFLSCIFRAQCWIGWDFVRNKSKNISHNSSIYCEYRNGWIYEQLAWIYWFYDYGMHFVQRVSARVKLHLMVGDYIKKWKASGFHCAKFGMQKMLSSMHTNGIKEKRKQKTTIEVPSSEKLPIKISHTCRMLNDATHNQDDIPFY